MNPITRNGSRYDIDKLAITKRIQNKEIGFCRSTYTIPYNRRFR